MNLRQEIYHLVYNHTDDYGKCEECEYRRDQIIKLFEKRIDELDTEYKLKVQDVKYRIGYYNALLDVRDILK